MGRLVRKGQLRSQAPTLLMHTLVRITPLAEQGDAESQLGLGIMYSDGMGVTT